MLLIRNKSGNSSDRQLKNVIPEAELQCERYNHQEFTSRIDIARRQMKNVRNLRRIDLLAWGNVNRDWRQASENNLISIPIICFTDREKQSQQLQETSSSVPMCRNTSPGRLLYGQRRERVGYT
jgi:hypothetical protein